MRALGVLLLFVIVVRVLPGVARPAVAGDNCGQAARTDLFGMERCLVQRPGDIELMIDLADGYQTAGQRDRAEALLQRALIVDPDDGELRRRLADFR